MRLQERTQCYSLMHERPSKLPLLWHLLSPSPLKQYNSCYTLPQLTLPPSLTAPFPTISIPLRAQFRLFTHPPPPPPALSLSPPPDPSSHPLWHQHGDIFNITVHRWPSWTHLMAFKDIDIIEAYIASITFTERRDSLHGIKKLPSCICMSMPSRIWSQRTDSYWWFRDRLYT